MGIDIISVFNPPKEKITWRDIFDCKKHYGHYDIIREAAKDAGYKYFQFNGRIYGVEDSLFKCLEEDVK